MDIDPKGIFHELQRPERGSTMAAETVWVDAQDLRQTDKALLCETEAGEVWLPKWAAHAVKRNAAGAIIRREVDRWWAEKKGLADAKDEW